MDTSRKLVQICGLGLIELKTIYLYPSSIQSIVSLIYLPECTLPDSATVAIARDDDFTFGVLHSKLHEVWALQMGTSLEDRPLYTPSNLL